jgi:low molecular weight protein-tyrosine phosphatase
MTERVLIVCVGNICRSPMAEVVLRQQLADRKIVVESAGLAAMVGSPIDPLAESVLVAHGLSGKTHLARQIEGTLVKSADVVFTMDKRQRAALLALAPWARSKVVLLGQWQGDVEIPDPYRQQRPAFEQVYQMIDAAISSWHERL